MTLKKNIGKNTIGDNKKMEVDLRTYNMSTHDLSTIFRNTQSPGTLVPNLCLLAQKGDTLDIDIESHVLTHPTVGPLFGSFKHENHLFTVPIRLYNSWLHNNRTKVGLDMSQIKLPQLRATLTIADNPYQANNNHPWTQINPSCLLAYLGVRGYGMVTGDTGQNVNIDINAVPLIGYYDIFKNYYANTQEEKFWTIGATPKVTKVTVTTGTDIFVSDNPDKMQIPIINNKSTLQFQPAGIFQNDDLELTFFSSASETYLTFKPEEIGDFDADEGDLAINKLPSNQDLYILRSMTSKQRVIITDNNLEQLDELRDEILLTKGNTAYIVSNSNDVPLLKSFTQRMTTGLLNTTSSQFGLALKTYNSDLLQNWINTEWIEGVQGINEISAVDVTDGKLTMDALNLAQKVYNMLNRIAVSGGTYRDWLETVFTGGNYMERCETPVFEGGMSQEIVFQEVISNSASGEEPLGTLAGRGISTERQKGGHVKIKVTEPCYIIGIGSITPRIDYSQGNEFYAYHQTVDDIHKPALDGIGYQDSVNWQRAFWDRQYNTTGQIQQPAVGKTVAWINYMTNINRTFGNFADNNSEAFMVMNRNYEYRSGTAFGTTAINDLTTYIDPVKFNYIFADTNLDAMNFWVQTKFDIKCRRLISAKQIPNL